MIWYILVLILVAVLYSRAQLKGQWPDGPRGLPFIGIRPDKKLPLYQQLAKYLPRYGDFFSLPMGNSQMVVLSSPAAIEDLIVKRGGKYSSRPAPTPQTSIVGEGRLVMMQYGDEFRVSYAFRRHGRWPSPNLRSRIRSIANSSMAFSACRTQRFSCLSRNTRVDRR
jgi:hypothetical protein